MNAIEMRKYAFTYMVENNKDETIKTLIKYDIENNKLLLEKIELQQRIDKAIEYIERENTDISTIDKMNILDILRGEKDE